jgi:hypothetical protein
VACLRSVTQSEATAVHVPVSKRALGLKDGSHGPSPALMSQYKALLLSKSTNTFLFATINTASETRKHAFPQHALPAITMQLTAVIVSTVLALSTGADAWTKSEAGKSVANDKFYSLRGM